MSIRIVRIARRQATIGGFAPEATPSPPLPMAFDSMDEDADDGDDDDALDDDDGDASSTHEMFSRHSYPLSFMTKMGSSFGYDSSHS